MSDYSNIDGDRPLSGEELEDFLHESFNREVPHVEYRETNSAFANNIKEFELM